MIPHNRTVHLRQSSQHILLSAKTFKLEIYFKKWKIKIKTEIINNQITLYNETIQMENHIKYLSLTLEKVLTFCKHTEISIKKATAALNISYPLLASNSPLNKQLKITLYKSGIRPILAPRVTSRPADNHYSKLQFMQNKIFRVINNTKRSIRITKLHEIFKFKYSSFSFLELLNC